MKKILILVILIMVLGLVAIDEPEYSFYTDVSEDHFIAIIGAMTTPAVTFGLNGHSAFDIWVEDDTLRFHNYLPMDKAFEAFFECLPYIYETKLDSLKREIKILQGINER